ncbi:MAG: TolC family protein [Pseudomonadota bacterium]
MTTQHASGPPIAGGPATYPQGPEQAAIAPLCTAPDAVCPPADRVARDENASLDSAVIANAAADLGPARPDVVSGATDDTIPTRDPRVTTQPRYVPWTDDRGSNDRNRRRSGPQTADAAATNGQRRPWSLFRPRSDAQEPVDRDARSFEAQSQAAPAAEPPVTLDPPVDLTEITQPNAPPTVAANTAPPVAEPSLDSEIAAERQANIEAGPVAEEKPRRRGFFARLARSDVQEPEADRPRRTRTRALRGNAQDPSAPLLTRAFSSGRNTARNAQSATGPVPNINEPGALPPTDEPIDGLPADASGGTEGLQAGDVQPLPEIQRATGVPELTEQDLVDLEAARTEQAAPQRTERRGLLGRIFARQNRQSRQNRSNEQIVTGSVGDDDFGVFRFGPADEEEDETSTSDAADDVEGGDGPVLSEAIAQVPDSESQRRPLKERKNRRDFSLSEAIDAAVRNDPRVGQAKAKADEAGAAIRTATSALKPLVSGTVGAGQFTSGRYDENTRPGNRNETRGYLRTDFGLSVRQMIFDFHANRSDVDRSYSQYLTRRFQMYEDVESTAHEMTEAYLQVLQQRQIAGLARENLDALNDLLALVEANEEAGNATVADVKRVSSRIVEAETLLTDLESGLDTALDTFRRLARVDAGKLQPPPSMRRRVPSSVDAALGELVNTNPELLALMAEGDALASERKAQGAKRRGRLEARVDANVSGQWGQDYSSEADVRGMFVFSTDLYDGGRNKSLSDQIDARLDENAMKLQRAREEAEADLKQFYRAIDASRSKTKRLADGVADSEKVNELYIEQFGAGTRTIFELLDSQTALFASRTEQITNQFEELRASYKILQILGKLTSSVLESNR